MGQSEIRPTDAEMVALGEQLAAAVRSGDELVIHDALLAWDDAMTDRFMSVIEEGQR